MKRPTNAQRRVLLAIDACSTRDDPADGWGEVFTHFDRANRTPSSLEMRNFDRSSDACKRNGWLRDDEGVALTDAGRAVLEAATEAARAKKRETRITTYAGTTTITVREPALDALTKESGMTYAQGGRPPGASPNWTPLKTWHALDPAARAFHGKCGKLVMAGGWVKVLPEGVKLCRECAAKGNDK